MEIFKERQSQKSTIFCYELSVNASYDIMEEQTIADAILDRLPGIDHRIELKRKLLRKTK